jgi:hypothetical protein
MKTPLKTWIQAIVISAIGVPMIGCVTAHIFRFQLYQRDRFQTPVELFEFVEGEQGAAGTLWEGTFYLGDHNDLSLFLHKNQLSRPSILELQKDSWIPPQRMSYTTDSVQWISWSDCRPSFE